MEMEMSATQMAKREAFRKSLTGNKDQDAATMLMHMGEFDFIDKQISEKLAKLVIAQQTYIRLLEGRAGN